jgi:hypothetical protein
MIHRWMLLGAICLFAVGLVGCSSGGNGLAPVPAGIDVTGWWEMQIRGTGSGNPFTRVTLVQMEQNGNVLTSEGQSLTINGTTVHFAEPNETDPDRTVSDWTIVSSDLIEVTSESYRNGVLDLSLDMRLERITAPVGTLVANGLVEGQTVNVNTPTGFATLQYFTQFPPTTSDLTLSDSQPNSSLDIEIGIDDLAPIAPGTYNVEPWTAMDPFITISVRTESSFDDAASGDLTFTEFNAGRVAGNGTVTLESGATFTFSFDVDIVATYDMVDIIN